MKKVLSKFEVKKLNLRYLELMKGGKLVDGGTMCGTLITNSAGSDSDAGGTVDADTGA